MSFKDSLTPKDTEEIKPGLFIQKKGDNYKCINPIAWNGEWRLKKQFGWRNLFFIILILFIAYNYHANTKNCEEFQANPCIYLQNLTMFCMEKQESQPIDQDLLGEIKSGDGKRDTFIIQDNP